MEGLDTTPVSYISNHDRHRRAEYLAGVLGKHMSLSADSFQLYHSSDDSSAPREDTAGSPLPIWGVCRERTWRGVVNKPPVSYVALPIEKTHRGFRCYTVKSLAEILLAIHNPKILPVLAVVSSQIYCECRQYPQCRTPKYSEFRQSVEESEILRVYYTRSMGSILPYTV